MGSRSLSLALLFPPKRRSLTIQEMREIRCLNGVFHCCRASMIEKFNSIWEKSTRDFSPADLIVRASGAKCLFLGREEDRRA
jgi:hypothetical protein